MKTTDDLNRLVGRYFPAGSVLVAPDGELVIHTGYEQDKDGRLESLTEDSSGLLDEDPPKQFGRYGRG